MLLSAEPGSICPHVFSIYAAFLEAVAFLSNLGRAGGIRLRQEEKMNFDPKALPDLFQKAPKPISPKTHAWLDVAVTSAYALAGALFLARDNKRAATAAFINAGMVAGVSLLTDYDGDGQKPISFKLHGFFDLVQAATAATAPVLFGFAREAASALFYSQSSSEVGVVALTDWNAGEPTSEEAEHAA